MSVARDLAAWLALVGLVQLFAVPLFWLLRPTPEPVCRLVALVPVSLAAYGWTALAARPAPWAGAFEQIGTIEPQGGAAWMLGGAGWVVWAVRRRSRGTGTIAPVVVLATATPLLVWPYTLLPPWAIDETAYHLGLPMHALVAGAVAAPLGHGNGGFYALGEWAGAWGLAMGSVSSARGIQILAWVLGGHAALSLLPKMAHRRWLCAWLCLLFSPVALWQLPTAYVDLLLTAFVLVAALATGRWLGGGGGRGLAGACGLLLGAAIATKPTASVLLPPFAMALAKGSTTQSTRALGTGFLCALLVPLPFVAFNCWHYHTPLFPFSAPWSPSPYDLLPAQSDVLRRFFAQHGPTYRGHAIAGPVSLVLLPWGLLVQARFASARFDGVLGAAGALALILSLWAWARRCRGSQDAAGSDATWHHQRAIAGQWAAISGLGWLVGSWQARFLLPALGLLLLHAALGAPPLHYRWQRLAAALCAISLQLLYWPLLRGHVPPMPIQMLASAERRAALRATWSPESRLCQGQQMAGARVALIWSQRQLVFCPQAALADSYDEAAHLDAWLDADDGAERAAHNLSDLGITHVLVNEALWFAAAPNLSSAERDRGKRIALQWAKLKQTRLTRTRQERDTVCYRWSLNSAGPPFGAHRHAAPAP